MKNIILPSLVVLGIVGLIIGFGSVKKPASSPAISPYDENAKVMYFYSESCSWCQKQKTVLEELAQEGFKVKPMDVGKTPNYVTDYKIQGTPTFIAPDNQKLVGYQEKEKLKEFLEKYK